MKSGSFGPRRTFYEVRSPRQVATMADGQMLIAALLLFVLFLVAEPGYR